MMVVKPNKRRMRYMRDNPSSLDAGKVRGADIVLRKPWERMIFVAGLGGAAVLGLVLVALNFWH